MDNKKVLVTAEMVVKELKFRTLLSGDKQATLTLETSYDDQEVTEQLKTLADKKFVMVVVMEGNQ